MSSAPASWGHHIAVEEIGGVPFRMYVERPKRIGDLFAFAERWGARPYVVQGERVLTFAGLKSAVGARPAPSQPRESSAVTACSCWAGTAPNGRSISGPACAPGRCPSLPMPGGARARLADADGAEARAYARGPARRSQEMPCFAPRTVGARSGLDRRGGRGDPGR